MKKISVIVPVYNVEKYLDKCLTSLIKQTYKNFEIIVINDGSIDNSLAICNKYANKYDNVKVYDYKNAGVAHARNVGIKKATGDYLLFVDSDDYIDEKLLENLNEFLKKNDCDIVCFDMYKVVNNVNTYYHTSNSLVKDNIKRYIIGDSGPCNKLIKKKLFNNLKFMEKIYYEDLATMPILALYTNKIEFLEEPLYYYVQRYNSIMHQKKFSEKLLDIFTSLDNVYEVYDGNYKDEIEYLYITHLLRSASMRFLEYDDTKEYLKEINDIIRTRFPNWKKNKYLKLSSFKLKIICYLAYNKKYRLLKILMKIKK